MFDLVFCSNCDGHLVMVMNRPGLIAYLHIDVKSYFLKISLGLLVKFEPTDLLNCGVDL